MWLGTARAQKTFKNYPEAIEHVHKISPNVTDLRSIWEIVGSLLYRVWTHVWVGSTQRLDEVQPINMCSNGQYLDEGFVYKRGVGGEAPQLE